MTQLPVKRSDIKLQPLKIRVTLNLQPTIICLSRRNQQPALSFTDQKIEIFFRFSHRSEEIANIFLIGKINNPRTWPQSTRKFLCPSPTRFIPIENNVDTFNVLNNLVPLILPNAFPRNPNSLISVLGEHQLVQLASTNNYLILPKDRIRPIQFRLYPGKTKILCCPSPPSKISAPHRHNSPILEIWDNDTATHKIAARLPNKTGLFNLIQRETFTKKICYTPAVTIPELRFNDRI